MQSEDELGATIQRLKTIVFQHIRWLTRLVVLLVVALVILHRLYPPSLEWLGEIIGLPKPSLATIATLIVSLIILERVIVTGNLLGQPPFRTYATRAEAYNQLSDFLVNRSVTHLDLLQFSGDTARPFLAEVAKRWPKAKIRLLLMHPDVADTFDSDNKPNHRERINTTVRHIELLEKDHRGFKVNIGYYRTPPGLAAVVADSFVNVGWYRCFHDGDNPEVIRLRGHNLPAITALDEEATTLQSFAKSHFEEVWAAKET